MNAERFWRENVSLQHITPPGNQMPEEGLFDVLRKVCVGSVFEFGCGYGRLALAFEPERYIGFDINKAALQEARRCCPQHKFAEELCEADTFLAHTVLLHVDDEAMERLAQRMRAYRRVVIGEIVGRRWRRTGEPMVFNREVSEYEALLGCKAQVTDVPYHRYGVPLTMMVFEP